MSATGFKATLAGVREWYPSDRATPYLFVLPAIVTVFLVTIIPMLWSLYLTLHRWSPGSINPVPQFNGLDNFVWVLTNERFIHSAVNMVFYSGVGVALQVTLGIMLALALYNFVDNRLLRVSLILVFILPMMLAPIVVGRLFGFMFMPGGGVVNGILGMVGIEPVPWLQSRWLGLSAVLIADTWQWVGLPLIIVYGGRVGIPESRYEVANIYGSSMFQKFRYITFPAIKNLVAIAAILRFMDSYKFFDKLLVMTQGGPGTLTELPTYYTYVEGFNNFNIGRAATLSWVLTIGSMIIMFLFWKQFKSFREM